MKLTGKQRNNLRKKAKRKFYQKVVERQFSRCAVCGHRHRLILAHLIPLVQGGSNDLDNLVGHCLECEKYVHGRGPGCTDSAWVPLRTVETMLDRKDVRGIS